MNQIAKGILGFALIATVTWFAWQKTTPSPEQERDQASHRPSEIAQSSPARAGSISQPVLSGKKNTVSNEETLQGAVARGLIEKTTQARRAVRDSWRASLPKVGYHVEQRDPRTALNAPGGAAPPEEFNERLQQSGSIDFLTPDSGTVTVPMSAMTVNCALLENSQLQAPALISVDVNGAVTSAVPQIAGQSLPQEIQACVFQPYRDEQGSPEAVTVSYTPTLTPKSPAGAGAVSEGPTPASIRGAAGVPGYNGIPGAPAFPPGSLSGGVGKVPPLPPNIDNGGSAGAPQAPTEPPH